MKKYLRIISFITAMLLMLCACGGQSGNNQSDDPIEVKPVVDEPDPQPEPEPILYMDPLTGIMGEEDITNLRPYAVMINNIKEAQPLIGISDASIIYEAIAEGGITRLLAVYSDLTKVGMIGSIRSARPYYIELALGLDAIYIHAGGSDEAYSKLKSWNVDHMDGVNGGVDAKAFWRDQERKNAKYATEHTMVTSSGAILNYINNSSKIRTEHKDGYNTGLAFGESSAAVNGSDAAIVKLVFSNYKNTIFNYDEASGLYKVSQYDKEIVDHNNNQTLTVKNILILNTLNSTKTIDKYTYNAFVTTGSGDGFYYCEGKYIPITWERSTRNDSLVYKTNDGQILELLPGKTYIGVISPKISKIVYPEN